MRRPNRTEVIALLALFVALGGTATAAVALRKGQVKSKHIAKNAVKSSKVKNGSLRARDFRASDLPAGPTGPRGLSGAAGATGPTGPIGPVGPSEVLMVRNFADTALPQTDEAPIATLEAPAGAYYVSATLRTANGDEGSGTFCFISEVGGDVLWAEAFDPADASKILTFTGGGELADAGEIGLYCANSSGLASQNDVYLTAVRAGAFEDQTPEID